jgi:hypothetical protein
MLASRARLTSSRPLLPGGDATLQRSDSLGGRGDGSGLAPLRSLANTAQFAAYSTTIRRAPEFPSHWRSIPPVPFLGGTRR